MKKGYVLWYDPNADDGLIKCLEDGKNYYFNSWSFSGTHYLIRHKKRVIRTRSFPGLFVRREVIPDKRIEGVDSFDPVYFERANDVDIFWAVRIDMGTFHDEILGYRLQEILEAARFEEDPIWADYYDLCIERILKEIDFL